MGSSAAFLYKRLIESGLGESVIGGGLDDTLLQNTFRYVGGCAGGGCVCM